MTVTTMLYRSTADADVSGDGRTVSGLAFRWNHPSLVSDDGVTRYRESFPPGCVGRTLRQRTTPRPLFVEHRHVEGSVGETTFTTSDEGLVFESRLYDGVLAEVARERLGRGELPAVSVGFRALATRTRRDAGGELVERSEIALDELSLCPQGQHDGALVLSVRAAKLGTPRLDRLRQRRLLLGPPR